MRIDDEIDPTVGFIAAAKLGDRVSGDEDLGMVFCETKRQKEAVERIQASYEISDQSPRKYRN